jgi:hypothetical protein
MTAKIKLNAASGGGSFSLQAPSSSSNNRVMTLPDSADGTILTTTNPKAGSIIQVVQHSTGSEVSSTSQSYVDSGLSGAITTTGSNKVLVIVNQQFRVKRSTTRASGGFQIVRGSTVITTGPNNESGTRGFGIDSETVDSGATLTALLGRLTMTYLDSPSAGTHTYKTQMSVLSSSNSGEVRAQYSTTDNGFSFLTLMEVAV